MNNEFPLVSVIMPSYNHEKYIEEAIRSVWEQTYSNVELVVLDDGSKDNSPEIIKELKKISPIPMKVVLKENEGICQTLNKGLELSEGKYICPLASDDRFMVDKIFLMVSEYENSSPDIGAIFAKCYAINESGIRQGEFAKNMKDKFTNNTFEDLLLWRYVFQYSTGIFSKQCLTKVGGYNKEYRFEDWDLYLRLSKKYSIKYMDKFVAEYRVDSGDNLSRQFSGVLTEDVLSIFSEHSKSYQRMDGFFWKKYAKGKIYLKIANWNYASQDYKNTRVWLTKVMLSNPFDVKAYDLLLRTLVGKSIIQRVKRMKNARKLFC